MVYCLILLVQLTPKQHLALGIAVLSAGGGAGGGFVTVQSSMTYLSTV
jgi:hypothetical protein